MDLLLDYADGRWVTRAYCREEQACGRVVVLDLKGLIARYGDMPATECRRRLICSACGSRARLISSYVGGATLSDPRR